MLQVLRTKKPSGSGFGPRRRAPSRGQPALMPTITPFEPRLGFDSRRVRIHAGEPAVGAPDDRREREADAQADRVMRAALPAPVGSTQAAGPDASNGRDAGAGLDVETAVRAAASGGEPLPDSLRSYFEPRFGHDFSQVRLHTDDAAAAGAQAVEARAYTLGSHVLFGRGEYAPHTPRGDRLMAHELAHVVQGASGMGAGAGQTLHREALPGADALAAPPAAPAPAAAPAAPGQDAEGNPIAVAAGHPYVSAKPAALGFPAKASYRFQALPPNPNATYNALHTRVEQIKNEQLGVADSFKGGASTFNPVKGDMKYWFAKVYHYVTKNELAAVDTATYLYPIMKLQEVVSFQTTYRDNLERWMAGDPSKVEANWRAAFTAAEGENQFSWFKPRSFSLKEALIPSMEAHIRFDLPRAIATVYEEKYDGIPGLTMGDFEPDFNAMGPVFDKATADIQPEMDEVTRLWDPGHYGPAQQVGFPFMFNVPMERRHAWEKAEVVANNYGSSSAAIEKQVEINMTGAHPGTSSADMSVDGTSVTTYDWKNQKKDPKSP